MENLRENFQRRLRKAVECHGPEAKKKVLEEYLEPYYRGGFTCDFAETPAVCVCAATNRSMLLDVLMQSGWDADQSDSLGRTPLHIAVYNQYEYMVKFLLNKKVSLNLVTHQKETPLHLASRGKYLEIVKLLVEAGATVDCIDAEGKTPLLLACNLPDWDMASYLVEKGADVNLPDPCGKTPLLFAASANLRLFSDLLMAKALVDSRNGQGETALHLIVRKNRMKFLDWKSEAIELLLTYRCDINARTNLGRTPLHYAVFSEDRTGVVILIRAGCSMDIEDESGATPVSYAIKKNCYHLAELLLSAGSSMSDSEWMDVQEVLRRKDPSMLERLLTMRSEVPKLLNICRRHFLKRYGVKFQNRIDDLELPSTLKRYLAFETL